MNSIFYLSYPTPFQVVDCRPLAVDDPVEIEQIRAVTADRLSKLWDPQTGRRHRTDSGVGARVGDPAIVGVARPADYSDPNLTKCTAA